MFNFFFRNNLKVVCSLPKIFKIIYWTKKISCHFLCLLIYKQRRPMPPLPLVVRELFGCHLTWVDVNQFLDVYLGVCEINGKNRNCKVRLAIHWLQYDVFVLDWPEQLLSRPCRPSLIICDWIAVLVWAFPLWGKQCDCQNVGHSVHELFCCCFHLQLPMMIFAARRG